MSANLSGAREEIYPFLTEIAEIRRRARQHIRQGVVASGYDADREVVLRLLNEALATELMCGLRYRRHYFMAGGASTEPIKQEFMKHAQEEQGHADMIAQRIVQLGGEPNFNPEGMSGRAHFEYGEGDTLADMIEEDLIAECIAIENYREIIKYLGDKDVTTRRVFESILLAEEGHAEELANMREDMLRHDKIHSVDNRVGELQ